MPSVVSGIVVDDFFISSFVGQPYLLPIPLYPIPISKLSSIVGLTNCQPQPEPTQEIVRITQ
jgi:hypothetical protein